jgi:MoxR-like ATPase
MREDASRPSTDDEAAIERLGQSRDRVVEEIRKIIVGMDHVIDELMMAIFSRGHCLLVGVPGLAKTLLVSSLAQALSLSFKRIQFTPDLMPSDITGTELLQEDPETRQRKFSFVPGPVFANIILADEINRTPPKTQAALLEAMLPTLSRSGLLGARVPVRVCIL